MGRSELLKRVESKIAVERVGDGFEMNCLARAVRLSLRPIKLGYDFAPNVLPVGIGYSIHGWLCGAPTLGMIIRQPEVIAEGTVHFGFIYPRKFPDERRMVVIPIPPAPRRLFSGYIETLEPFLSWGPASRAQH
jgi:hypothetical protein